MQLYSIASGSSGNCIYVGGEEARILIDAGISMKRIREYARFATRPELKFDSIDELIAQLHKDAENASRYL